MAGPWGTYWQSQYKGHTISQVQAPGAPPWKPAPVYEALGKYFRTKGEAEKYIDEYEQRKAFSVAKSFFGKGLATDKGGGSVARAPERPRYGGGSFRGLESMLGKLLSGYADIVKALAQPKKVEVS